MAWFRKSNLEPLAVSMSGIRLGDRLLVVGCGDPGLVAALAAKSGLTGRACLVCPSADERVRAAAAVEAQGVLIESFDAHLSSLPFDEGTFDVTVIRSVLPQLDEAARAGCVQEVHRVIRPGGRCMVIDDVSRGGLARLIGGHQGARGYARPGAAADVLTAAGFRGVRTLATREALTFVEGVKANLENP